MEPQKIEPQKVTKPIQLLAAWLVGLIVVDGSFLTASSQFADGSWERSILVIAAILNVPLFLGAMFLLQTKFRAELQEDLFYSKYLDNKTNKLVTVSRDVKLEKELKAINRQIASLHLLKPQNDNPETNTINGSKPLLGNKWSIGVNDYLDNFDGILNYLEGRSIPVADIFGSSYTNDKIDRKIVTLSKKIDLESKIEIIKIAHALGMDGYNYYADENEQLDEEDILFGSYGYKDTECIPIDNKLVSLLDKNTTNVRLKYFESKNKIKLS